jgi:hypothetical protein
VKFRAAVIAKVSDPWLTLSVRLSSVAAEKVRVLARPRLSSPAEGAEIVVGPATLGGVGVMAVGSVWATLAPATMGVEVDGLVAGVLATGAVTAGAVTAGATPLNSGEEAVGVGDSDGADKVEIPGCDSGSFGVDVLVVAWPAASSGKPVVTICDLPAV